MKKNKPIIIADTAVNPGEYKLIDVPAARLYTHAPVYMPVHVINGKEPGPRLFVSAAIHGDEINGVESIRRLLQIKNLRQIKGTLIAVPIVNIYGFISLSRYLPDRRDLNRCFPGTEYGSVASRLAYLFMNEIVSKCTHGIDLHSAAVHRINLPQIRYTEGTAQIEELCRAFNVPVIMETAIIPGSLRDQCHKRKIPLLVYEAGESLRFDEVYIRAATQGILNVMRFLKMLPEKRASSKKTFKTMLARSSTWVRAPYSGISHPFLQLGAHIKKGDKLGVIVDPFGGFEKEVKSPITGIVIGHNTLPLVNQGEALFHIASFKDMDTIRKEVDKFHDLQPADFPHPIIGAQESL